MKKSKFSEEQIVRILKEVEEGAKVNETCRKHGISEPTYYVWKNKYAGMDVAQLRHSKDVEVELARLKRNHANANAHGRYSTHEWSPKVRQAIEPSQSSTACSDAQKHCRRIRRPVRRNRIQPSLCAPSPNELPSVASHIAHPRRQR